MRGFESYNKLKKDIRDSRQIYDITYHLYQVENERLKDEIEKSKNNGTKQNITVNTSVGSIEHSLKALHERLEYRYPFTLRRLILISVITSLEVYLTDTIIEIFKRDISPFKKDEPIKFQKNYILNSSSLDRLKDDIIKKDFRSLTSGGLAQIEKYYKKTFNISLRNLGASFQEIQEIHLRRHLFVHRNGFVDSEYINKYPEFNYKLNDQIKLTHEYLIDSLNKISEFAGLINKEILTQFPEIKRKPEYNYGNQSFDFELKNLMIELSILKNNFDHIDYLENLTVRGKQFKDFIVQIVTIDGVCNLFLSGSQADISSFYNSLNNHRNLSINKTIELKNNVR